MTNVDLARRTVAAIRGLGVSEFCVCSGSRNAPLLAVLAATPDLHLRSFVDERSAGFFALGVAKRTKAPACVVTTSGTAVAELLPAAIEAYYSGIPIVILSADRPARFIGTGAPQTIEQDGLFGRYAVTHVDDWDGESPLHLNVAFEEPLIDGAVEMAGTEDPPQPRRQIAPLRQRQLRMRKPVVLIGGLAPEDRDRVREFAVRFGAPVYAEPLSGLREDSSLASLRIENERMIERGGFDGVVRIGDVPTLRFWRDLDSSLSNLEVASFSHRRFPGLSRGEVAPLEELPMSETRGADLEFLAEDRKKRAAVDEILRTEPESELGMFRALSEEVPVGSRVYLGNSLPVREWDLAATRTPRGFVFAANRGANGIDGQLSTFLGWCAEGAMNVAVLGDLTTLYDANAPWIVPQLTAGFRLVVINNSGGRIFERVRDLRSVEPDVRKRIIDNPHKVRFSSWAEMWGLDYTWVTRFPAGLVEDRRRREVVELEPDLEASRRAWARYDQVWA